MYWMESWGWYVTKDGKKLESFAQNQSGWKQIDGDGGIWIAFFFRLLPLLLTTLRGHAGGNNSEYIWHSGLEMGLIFWRLTQ